MKTRNSATLEDTNNTQYSEPTDSENHFYRPNSHSHIKPLTKYNQLETPRHFVKNSKILKSVVTSVKSQNNHSIVISGPCSSGKSALINSLHKEIMNDKTFPFSIISASELNSLFSKSPNLLISKVRECVGVQLRDVADLVEGEVINLELEAKRLEKEGEQYHFHSGSLTLRTSKMDSTFKIGPELTRKLQEEHITVGDIIQVSRTSGELKRMGRSRKYVVDDEVYNSFQRFLEVPEGELQKRYEERHYITLNEMDALNNKGESVEGLLTSGDSVEIEKHVFEAVDEKVNEWVVQGRGIVTKGILVVENAYLLNEGTASLLRILQDAKHSPSFIFVTNDKVERKQGRIWVAGLPMDIIERAIILQTKKYNKEELEFIVLEKTNENVKDKMLEIVSAESLEYMVRLVDIIMANEECTAANLTNELVDEYRKMFKGFNGFSEGMEKEGIVFLDDQI